MHISVQHTTRNSSIDKECCVDAIKEAAHNCFREKAFVASLFDFVSTSVFPSVCPLSLLCVKKYNKTMPTVQNGMQGRNETSKYHSCKCKRTEYYIY